MEIRQNAFGDYLIYEKGVNKGYTLKILGIYKVFNKKGLIGHILKKDDEYFHTIISETVWRRETALRNCF